MGLLLGQLLPDGCNSVSQQHPSGFPVLGLFYNFRSNSNTKIQLRVPTSESAEGPCHHQYF